jgi:hypothetical protein
MTYPTPIKIENDDQLRSAIDRLNSGETQGGGDITRAIYNYWTSLGRDFTDACSGRQEEKAAAEHQFMANGNGDIVYLL